jgi:rhamnosyltransferase
MTQQDYRLISSWKANKPEPRRFRPGRQSGVKRWHGSAALDALRARGGRVAGVAAAFSDPRGGTIFPLVRLGRLRMRPVAVTGTAPVECDLLISSGSLIPLDAAETVGSLDSGGQR